MGMNANVWSLTLSKYDPLELSCSQHFLFSFFIIFSSAHKSSCYLLLWISRKPFFFRTLFHNFQFIPLFFFFCFIFFLYMEGFYFLQHHRLRETFFALIDFPFSFRHTPNIGFWRKLVISIKPIIMRIMVNGFRKVYFS